MPDDTWPSQEYSKDACDAYDRKRRDRRLGRARRQNEFEERHGIAPIGLSTSHRAIAPTDDERRTLGQEQPDAGPQTSIAPARHGAGPDVTETRQLSHRPDGMKEPP
jgi:hypothetical protein